MPPGPAPVGGLLLEVRPIDSAAPVAAPDAGPDVAGSPATPSTPSDQTTADPAEDRSPRIDNAGNGGATEEATAPSAASAPIALPNQLALSDILPFTPTTAITPSPDARPPTGPAPAGDAIAEYGHASHRLWPLLAGLAVSLVILLIGGGFLWWRNRDSRYWPA